jgi:hypothetical protein
MTPATEKPKVGLAKNVGVSNGTAKTAIKKKLESHLDH